MKPRNSDPLHAAQELQAAHHFGGYRERNATPEKVRARYLVEELRIAKAQRDHLFQPASACSRALDG